MNSEFLNKAKHCKTLEELRVLAKVDGIELSDEELEQVLGGANGALLGVMGAITGMENEEDKNEPKKDENGGLAGTKMFELLELL